METIESILIIIVAIVVGILICLFRSWFYGKGGPIDSIGISEDDQANLEKLIRTGVFFMDIFGGKPKRLYFCNKKLE